MTTREQARIDETLNDFFATNHEEHPRRSTGDDEVRFADESDWLEDEA